MYFDDDDEISYEAYRSNKAAARALAQCIGDGECFRYRGIDEWGERYDCDQYQFKENIGCKHRCGQIKCKNAYKGCVYAMSLRYYNHRDRECERCFWDRIHEEDEKRSKEKEEEKKRMRENEPLRSKKKRRIERIYRQFCADIEKLSSEEMKTWKNEGEEEDLKEYSKKMEAIYAKCNETKEKKLQSLLI